MTLADFRFAVTFLAGAMLLAAPVHAQSTRSAQSIPSVGIQGAAQKPVAAVRASSKESELAAEKDGGLTLVLILVATLGVFLAVASSGNDSPG